MTILHQQTAADAWLRRVLFVREATGFVVFVLFMREATGFVVFVFCFSGHRTSVQQRAML
jgi:hypothetical protein